MATTDFANLPGRGIKPLVSFRAHTRVALIVFIFTLLAGIPLAFIKGEVFFSTVAVVQVAPRYMKTLRDDGELDFPSNTQYREFLEQQTKSVTRYDIVRDALIAVGLTHAAIQPDQPVGVQRVGAKHLPEPIADHDGLPRRVLKIAPRRATFCDRL